MTSKSTTRIFIPSIIAAWCFFASPGGPAAQKLDPPELQRARLLLQMEPARAKAEIEALSGKEAAVMITQALYLTRKNNPDLDRVYLLLRHLEALRSQELAQKRLNNLLLVLGITLLLFSAFLIYVMLDQRGSLRDLQALLKNVPPSATNASGDVYRGD